MSAPIMCVIFMPILGADIKINEVNNMENDNAQSIFHCYSFRLCHFLQSQGFRYLRKCKNRNNNLTYFTFEKSDTLNKALSEWNNLKEKSKTEEI